MQFHSFSKKIITLMKRFTQKQIIVNQKIQKKSYSKLKQTEI